MDTPSTALSTPAPRSAVAAQPTQPPAAPAQPHEYLSFRLGAEEYGIDILRVQEIRSFEPPTRMVNAPDYILGVINLRGVIVPIVDMRLKFQLAQANYDSFTVVIVLNLGQRVVGLVVDAVSDVISLTPEQLHAAPDFSAGTANAIGHEHVRALASLGQRMLVLLDIAALMARPDMGLATTTTTAAAAINN